MSVLKFFLISVGHVKIICQGVKNPEQYVIGNLTGEKNTLQMRGNDFRDEEVTMILNARVQMTPQELEKIADDAVKKICEKYSLESSVEAQESLQPGRPDPTYRYEEIVEV